MGGFSFSSGERGGEMDGEMETALTSFFLSVVPVDMLKLKLGESFDNIFVVFSFCCHH
jgi:hypothetical protein